MESQVIRKKIFIGKVISHKMDKTAVVAVERLMRHPRYGKYIWRTKKFYVHDENNVCKEGDIVKIIESRPLSRLKRWRLLEVLQNS